MAVLVVMLVMVQEVEEVDEVERRTPGGHKAKEAGAHAGVHVLLAADAVLAVAP